MNFSTSYFLILQPKKKKKEKKEKERKERKKIRIHMHAREDYIKTAKSLILFCNFDKFYTLTVRVYI